MLKIKENKILINELRIKHNTIVSINKITLFFLKGKWINLIIVKPDITYNHTVYIVPISHMPKYVVNRDKIISRHCMSEIRLIVLYI